MIAECMQMRTWITQFEDFIEKFIEEHKRELEHAKEVHMDDMTQLAMTKDELSKANGEKEKLSKEVIELKNKIKEMQDTSKHNDNTQEKADPI